MFNLQNAKTLLVSAVEWSGDYCHSMSCIDKKDYVKGSLISNSIMKKVNSFQIRLTMMLSENISFYTIHIATFCILTVFKKWNKAGLLIPL